MTEEQRFHQNIQVNQDTDCWVWVGGRYPKGYGRFYNRRITSLMAHRYAYTLYIGPIPVNICVCHHCDNPPCVNPDHLFLGTHRDNSDDKVAKGRHVLGETHGNAKLTSEQVSYIQNSDISGIELAAEFGVSAAAVSAIRLGKAWKHLSGVVVRKDRYAKGENHGSAKLTSEQVLYVRQSKLTQRALARELGVGQSAIGKIRTGQRWVWL